MPDRYSGRRSDGSPMIRSASKFLKGPPNQSTIDASNRLIENIIESVISVEKFIDALPAEQRADRTKVKMMGSIIIDQMEKSKLHIPTKLKRSLRDEKAKEPKFSVSNDIAITVSSLPTNRKRRREKKESLSDE